MQKGITSLIVVAVKIGIAITAGSGAKGLSASAAIFVRWLDTSAVTLTCSMAGDARIDRPSGWANV